MYCTAFHLEIQHQFCVPKIQVIKCNFNFDLIDDANIPRPLQLTLCAYLIDIAFVKRHHIVHIT